MNNTQHHCGHLIAVIGAGPAGLYATKKLLDAGASVVLFNRDIKPGGLAEYGIFPTKHKMKEGLRKQFRKILAHPQVDYYGNVLIGETGDFTLDDLRAFGFDALVFAVGAQGTNTLGLPGEDAAGVIHAKDLVYFYNRLPPFSQCHFPIGKRVAIVGMGNVMIDVAHFLLRVWQGVEEVVVVARRGPAERKYDVKEYQYVEPFVDQDALRQEILRLRPRLEAVGQDVEGLIAEMTRAQSMERPDACSGRMTFRFLTSPTRVLTDADGKVRGLELEENCLLQKNDTVAPRGTGQLVELPVDTVVFAIGDRVDATIGLPYARGEFVTNLQATAHSGIAAYQVYDPACQQILEQTYVIGWARKASDGLVGKAKQDADIGAELVLQALATIPAPSASTVVARRQTVRRTVENQVSYLITQDEVAVLEDIERQYAEESGLEAFKFETNDQMIAAIDSHRAVVV